MPARPLLISAALTFATIVAGIAIRFAHLGLPRSLTKYGGSALWAMMIYWLVSTFLPRSVTSAAIASGLLAAAVEFFKLVQNPTLDAFRITLPGVILLGRFFSLWDIVAYWFAICVAAFADAKLCQRLSAIRPSLTLFSRP